MTKKAIITFGGGSGVKKEPKDVFQFKGIQVKEVEFPYAPKDRNGNIPVTAWVLNTGQNFQIPTSQDVNIIVPAGQTITIHSSLELDDTIKRIYQVSGSNQFIDSNVASTWKLLNTGTKYQKCKIDGERIIKTYKNGINYWIDIVKINPDGTETVLSSSDTGINAYTGDNDTYSMVVKVGTKYVFIGKDTNYSYTRYRVFSLNGNTVSWLAGNVSIYDNGQGNPNSALPIRQDAFIQKSQNNQYYYYKIVNNTVQRVGGGLGMSYTDTNVRVISDGYITIQSGTQNLSIYYVNTNGSWSNKTTFYNGLAGNSWNILNVGSNKFLVFGRHNSQWNKFRILLLEYSPTSNSITNLNELVVDTTYSSPDARGGLSIDDLNYLLFHNETNGMNTVGVTLNSSKTTITLKNQKKVYGINNTLYYPEVNYTLEIAGIMLVSVGSNKNKFFKQTDGTYKPKEVAVTSKKLNGVAFSDINEIKNHIIDSTALYFDYEIKNETDNDVSIPFTTSIVLFLLIQ